VNFALGAAAIVAVLLALQAGSPAQPLKHLAFPHKEVAVVPPARNQPSNSVRRKEKVLARFSEL
jgi:hypothetical protein